MPGSPVARANRRHFWFIVLGVGVPVSVLYFLAFADIASVCVCGDGQLRKIIRVALEDKDKLCSRACEGLGGGHWLRDGLVPELERKTSSDAGLK
ncbi:hypothetical protein MYSTI_03275 [Myxococcus stipitatus DSM 14675]|uniref:Uncharacterized protein n=1 Tax=Myxococcus stipitatus (strain DSM 14675 / JCM 12634 / Mx s8) TaxID=1278073 RepID=L7UAF7_MYXSD|nr:hypothetical protein MYSTI_03275 [Myxococcus stipitatus DSM 14675]